MHGQASGSFDLRRHGTSVQQCPFRCQLELPLLVSAKEKTQDELTIDGFLAVAQSCANLAGQADWLSCHFSANGLRGGPVLVATILLRGSSDDVFELLDAAESLPAAAVLAGDTGPQVWQVNGAGTQLLSFEPWTDEEPFQVCQRLFISEIKEAELGAELGLVPADAVSSLRAHGFCILDHLFDVKRCEELFEAARVSVHAWLEAGEPSEQETRAGTRRFAGGPGEQWLRQEGTASAAHGPKEWVSWMTPQPRSSRGDYIAGICKDQGAAAEEPLCEILSTFDRLLASIQARTLVYRSCELSFTTETGNVPCKLFANEPCENGGGLTSKGRWRETCRFLPPESMEFSAVRLISVLGCTDTTESRSAIVIR
ncbi:unnamed protein product [Polarella glacialis]|uniref:Uncharacterized protein n=1 Tax=Polarella glacialis TaxID=89957 RepID=A0A813HN85_POLGL|nr:unnamed protein product [Polarella glacialis]